jgi:excisionase family DNA binding protein
MRSGKQPAEPTGAKKVYTSAEACDFLRVSRPTLSRLVQSKKIGHFRVGVKLLFSREHLDQFLAQSEVKAVQEEAA